MLQYIADTPDRNNNIEKRRVARLRRIARRRGFRVLKDLAGSWSLVATYIIPPRVVADIRGLDEIELALSGPFPMPARKARTRKPEPEPTAPLSSSFCDVLARMIDQTRANLLLQKKESV